jgi:DNA-binding transcriptional LysR family regulator
LRLSNTGLVSGEKSLLLPEAPGGFDMELRRLRYFTVLARHLHFGRAAEELGIAQPGLSQQIKILERELGTSLLNRDRRGVTLTPAGTVLATEAIALLNQSEVLQRRVQSATQGMSGLLRVAYTRSGMDVQIGDLVRGFRDAYPNIEIEAHTGWTSWNIGLLQKRELDVIFVRGPVEESGLSLLGIAEEELVVALPEGHQLAACQEVAREAIRDEPTVLWPRHLGPAFYDRMLEQIWPDNGPKVVAQEPEAEQILAVVAGGIGLSVLDRRRSQKLCPPGVALRPFAGTPPTIAVSVAWHTRDRSATVRQFVGWCRSQGHHE